jgi:cysteinyl-tRNA synthetase
VDLVSLEAGVGWAAARNTGLTRSLGRIVLIVDGSVEATGDVLTPIEGTLRGGSVGLTGPFGIVTDDLREFRESSGPDVDAIEGYLMALPRDLLREGLRFDERFRFYRTADIELSFRVKHRGLRTVVTPVPVTRHEHRMWASTPEDRRAALSKRNYYRFLDAWRGRFDLTVAGVPPSTEGDRT